MIKRISLLLFLSCSLLMPSCQSDQTGEDNQTHEGPATADLLPGRWELTSAMRAGRQTELLTGTYFEFTPDGRMTTNFGLGNGRDQSAFELKGNIISPQDDKMQLKYEVVLINDTTLVLSTSIRDMPFEMTFAKVQEEEQEEGHQ